MIDIQKEYKKIYQKHYNDGVEHRRNYKLSSLDYTFKHQVDDAITMTYYDIFNNHKNKTLVKYAEKIFRNSFPDAVKEYSKNPQHRTDTNIQKSIIN